MQLNSTNSSLATPKGRRWLILCIGFTVATFQLCGLAFFHPSLANFFNVGIVSFFYALTWSLKPQNPQSVSPPRFGKEQLVAFNGNVGRIKNFLMDAGTWFYEVEIHPSEGDNKRLVQESEIRKMPQDA